jgi:hypothetical protein
MLGIPNSSFSNVRLSVLPECAPLNSQCRGSLVPRAGVEPA